ncbi:hypothetical protein SYNPS1DRAFT_23415 [Syncephalis pseudoplumigaleata]|uniref:Uncharacterized protein n=1 Tax=Syncephalis pseudoplumigaleata TaxID=1712513 RepID=A0A4P9YYR5_9FUNG|nr:hypothetical protein SYNPS1DRAFT_23415 [Syncephalis pseudoplumigaleata]|eukprot:RKP24511.1 hypothetical protein SYNPS1DRAFT_23415 [Syncephalis pseudoplumigaleata]
MSAISITANEHYSDTWAHNATRVWGIPMHPLSQMSILDFVTESMADGDVARARGRLFGIQLQLTVFILAGWVFVRNLVISVRLSRRQLHALPGWCCLISSLLGTSLAVLFGLAMVFPQFNCHILLWYFIFAKNISCFCHSTIILHKLYLALLRRRWVLIVGTVVNTLHLAFSAILIMTSVIALEPYYGCVIYYISLAPLLCVTTSTPQSALFLFVFSHIAYQQYRKLGLRAWRQLARDGIQAMILVLTVNLVCNLLLSFKVGRDLADAFFYIDWVLTLTILTNYCVNVCNAADSLSGPRHDNSNMTHVDITPTITSSNGRRFTSKANLTSYFNIQSTR